MYLDDTSNITIPEMKAKIRRINQDPSRKDIGVVIIDYLQLMSTGKRSESRVQEISEITRNLKIMAKELYVPVIALSQLSRSAEKSTGRTDHRPVLSDLRDSGSIEQLSLIHICSGFLTKCSPASAARTSSSWRPAPVWARRRLP